MWNLEWIVPPFGISKAAIPVDATAKTTFPISLRCDIIKFHKNVLPVPPCPSTRNNFPLLYSIDCNTCESRVCCSSVSLAIMAVISFSEGKFLLLISYIIKVLLIVCNKLPSTRYLRNVPMTSLPFLAFVKYQVMQSSFYAHLWDP